MTRKKLTDTSRHQPPSSVWSGWKDDRPSVMNPVFGTAGGRADNATWRQYVNRIYGGKHE